MRSLLTYTAVSILLGCIAAQPFQAVLPDPTDPAPAPRATSWTAALLRRFTSFDEAKIARIVGEASLHPPHPFVEVLNDSNAEATFSSSDEDTVWAVLVSANDQPSLLFDNSWNEVASNSTLALGPIPPPSWTDSIPVKQLAHDDPGLLPSNVRLGRIDYMKDSDLLLTKWLVFKCPMVVFVTDRGAELRFFPSGTISVNPERLGRVIREELWRQRPPWTGRFSPSGSSAWFPQLLGKAFLALHGVTETVPSWLLMLICTAASTTLLQWMHSGSRSPPPQGSRPGLSGSSTAPETSSRKSRADPTAPRKSSWKRPNGSEIGVKGDGPRTRKSDASQ